MSKYVKKEGAVHHGMTGTKTWWSWHFMKQRVLNPSNRDYHRYKDRHIDPKWMVFANFYADMGERPEGMSLDRIDNKGGYCKENCRWATAKQQAASRNMGNYRKRLSADSVKEIKSLIGVETLRNISQKYGVHQCTIIDIKYGRTWKEVAHV